MVVVFFGTPQFAVPTLRQLLNSRHVVRAVITQPDRPRGRGQKVTDSPVKAVAVEHGVEVLQPDRLRDPDLIARVRQWQPDLGVVVAYGKMIPDELLDVPRSGMINLHASLLPKYRGAAPVHRAIIDGAHETGVTIMRVARTLDAGDMLARVTRPIGPDETSEDVERELADAGARLMVDVIDRLEEGAVQTEPQDHSASTYAVKLTKAEGLIDWSETAAAIHNRVRGLHPWPHAYTYLDGERIILLRTRMTDARTDSPSGTVLAADAAALTVATGENGVIAIEELQPEGRRPMRTRDFLAGRPIAPGSRFTGP
jgi:methionyl-tRNA formyltransferase